MPERYADYRTTSADDAVSWLDGLTFLRSWLGDPRRVGAIAPSSPALARLICSEIDADDSPLLELGPGTGVFTAALLARGVAESRLTLIEVLPRFADLLRGRYPLARVLALDASLIGSLALYPEASVGAAVSGLPLRAMPHATIEAITAGIFRWLRPGACLYQFTYGLRCPIPAAILQRLGLHAAARGRVWSNLPPATVYRIARQTTPTD